MSKFCTCASRALFSLRVVSSLSLLMPVLMKIPGLHRQVVQPVTVVIQVTGHQVQDAFPLLEER